ncbi:MAG TPA: PASTA domain-containing protein [Clostridia bacterium]|nr:PASTA domain-containing protein [Clostridia bacterium]
MRRTIRWLLRALVIVIVGLASMLTAMRFAIHGREVTIPKLVGMSPTEAERITSESGLVLARDERYYSSDVPAGKIMSQSPAPGTRVRSGWRVRVAESLGAQSVTIPNVVGQSERAAHLNVARRGLEIGNVATVSLPELPGDQVIAQSPPADARNVMSPKLNLLLNVAAPAVPAFVMPDFVGSKLAEATVAVADAGLKVGKVTTVADPQVGPAGENKAGENKPTSGSETIVVRQSIGPGHKVSAGMSVDFEVVRR